MAAVSLTAASAGAFNQENGGAGGDSNSTFADPDEQVNIFGHGAQQSRLNAFKHFQSNGLTSPPDPLTRPSN